MTLEVDAILLTDKMFVYLEESNKFIFGIELKQFSGDIKKTDNSILWGA